MIYFLQVQIRLQLNILLDKIDGIEMFRNVPQLMFPVLWFDSEAVLPESMASPLNMLVVLQFLIQVSYAAHIGLLAVLTLLIMSGLWCLLCCHGRSHVSWGCSVWGQAGQEDVGDGENKKHHQIEQTKIWW